MFVKMVGKVQNNKLFKHDFIQILLIVFMLLPFYFFLYKIFSVRSLAFGCFDDCANYMAGYFMLNGEELYSEIFYNHIMGMAHLSHWIQQMHTSINIYDLVLSHRQVILLLAFILNICIIKRFKWVGLLFVILYELSKFYVFGDRFLAESIVVYLAVYLCGLLFLKLKGNTLSYADYVTSGIFAFLIIFLREPYIPFTIVAYGALLWGRIDRKRIVSICVFLVLIGIVAVNTHISDFIFNDFTVNMQTAISGETNSKNLLGLGLFQIFFSPIFIFFGGKWNLFRIFELGIAGTFTMGIIYQIFSKKWGTIISIFILLGLANIRVISPGTVYYEAYHGMVWFGVFLFTTLLVLGDLYRNHKRVGIILCLILITSWGIAVFSPKSYLFDKIDLQEQLITNFGPVMHIGSIIKTLSDPDDTVFLDGADDMIIWESKLFTPYKYSWYTSVMPLIPIYRDARIQMFKENPPDFYYDFCSKEAPLNPSLPVFVVNTYQQLYENGNKTCLYVLKSKIPEITKEQWKKAEEGFFTLPSGSDM